MRSAASATSPGCCHKRPGPDRDARIAFGWRRRTTALGSGRLLPMSGLAVPEAARRRSRCRIHTVYGRNPADSRHRRRGVPSQRRASILPQWSSSSMRKRPGSVACSSTGTSAPTIDPCRRALAAVEGDAALEGPSMRVEAIAGLAGCLLPFPDETENISRPARIWPVAAGRMRAASFPTATGRSENSRSSSRLARCVLLTCTPYALQC